MAHIRVGGLLLPVHAQAKGFPASCGVNSPEAWPCDY